MIQDKFLQSLVEKQTEMFNTGASEMERISIYQQIQYYQKTKKEQGR